MRWPVLLCLLLAGCAATPSQGITAMDAAGAADDAAQDGFEYALFLGITGTEGDLNWTAYEAALAAASDPGSIIAGAFDQDRDDGGWGDGELGSWLTTHFIYDQQRQLLGGLYTQATPDATETAFAKFRGPYGGTTTLPSLMEQTSLAAVASFDPGAGAGDTVLCGIVSTMEDWKISAAQAAEIALARPLMTEHGAATPGAELTYFYFPKLDTTPDCPVRMDSPSNYWVISLTDLDLFLAGGNPDVVEITIDAATGEVLDEVRRALTTPPPIVYDAVFKDDTPAAFNELQGDAMEIEVPGRAALLEIDVHTVERPTQGSPWVRLLTPAGEVWEERYLADDETSFRVTGPETGTWTLAFEVSNPVRVGTYEFVAQAVVSYP